MQVQNDVRVTIRVDRNLKGRAEALFDHLGMNMSTALNVFLRKAVEESAIPFSVSTKDTGFGNGYSASDITDAFTGAVDSHIKGSKQKNIPVARYDKDKKQAFLEFPDGKREYINA